jgi:hypothetical protein
MPITYTPINAYTVGNPQASYTITSIPNTYTDLVLIVAATTVTANYSLQFNGDTGTNYSDTSLWGTGSAAASYRSANNTVIGLTYTASGTPTTIAHIQNYANITTFKSAIIRQDDITNATGAMAGLWRNTAAINSLTIRSTGNLPTGTVITLYGIKAA